MLILDEPANGLDPQGIAWLRELLRAFVAEGRTAFVSSHLLAEMQEMADRVLVIGRGALIADSPIDDFMARASRHPDVLVRSPDASSLAELLRAQGLAVKAAAKMAMIALVTAVTATISAGAVWLIAALGFRSRLHGGVLDPGQLRAIGFGVLYLAAVAALAAALSAVTRSTVLAVLVIYLWAFGVEPLIGLATKAASDYLPFGAARRLMSAADGRVLLHAGVFISELALVAASAGWLFRRRDITAK